MCGTASVVNESCQFRVETSYEYIFWFVNVSSIREPRVSTISLPLNWVKIEALLDVLEKGYPWTVWVDTHLAIVNNTRSAEEYYALSTYVGLGPKTSRVRKTIPMNFSVAAQGPPSENCDVIGCSWPLSGPGAFHGFLLPGRFLLTSCTVFRSSS